MCEVREYKQASEGALDGIRAVELCQSIAGSYSTKLLADLGAEVIKIEDPGTGDPARMRGPFLNDVPHPERSGLFLYLNTNYIIDFKHPTFGPVKLLGFPVYFSKTPASVRSGAPEFGEHTEEVLREIGGYSWEEVAKLKEEEVI